MLLGEQQQRDAWTTVPRKRSASDGIGARTAVPFGSRKETAKQHGQQQHQQQQQQEQQQQQLQQRATAAAAAQCRRARVCACAHK